MPKVGYSEEERERIREALITTALALMARQGIQHTTVEQIYRAVGISRTFFYTFFSSKEDLIVETLYHQQPRILACARQLMEDPALTWREGVEGFLRTCCYGERNGIAVMTIEEQQVLFRRLSQESYRHFREKQLRLFARLLECFGIRPDDGRVALFTNLSLAVMVLRRAIPSSLPLLVPEAADAAVNVQIGAIVDCLEQMRKDDKPR
nr:TetR/AcrR family transcriptional regulator [Intestinimonas timonensis]